MFRIKYLLGAILAIFSLVYVLFGTVAWVDGRATNSELMLCFGLGSLHAGLGVGLLYSSWREYKRERRRLDTAVDVLLERTGGRIRVRDVARLAGVSDDDAREYLAKRAQREVSFVEEGRFGAEAYTFPQEWWNN
jgi:predicted HTH domain antitoxin